jgi:hypothetical protein
VDSLRHLSPNEENRIVLRESLPPGFTVAINAVSEDGEWIRFLIGTETYWIPSHSIDMDSEQKALTLGEFMQILTGNQAHLIFPTLSPSAREWGFVRSAIFF